MPSIIPAPANTSGEIIAAAHRRAQRYRVAAAVILALGFASAVIVYWLGSRQPDDSNDPAMLGFNRATDRQMGVLYGNSGQLIEDLNDSLKQPGTKAILIIIGSAVIATGCFYFARLLEFEAQNAASAPPPG